MESHRVRPLALLQLDLPRIPLVILPRLRPHQSFRLRPHQSFRVTTTSPTLQMAVVPIPNHTFLPTTQSPTFLPTPRALPTTRRRRRSRTFSGISSCCASLVEVATTTTSAEPTLSTLSAIAAQGTLTLRVERVKCTAA
jgi:hypothetical protein